jgi:hypothetical protein
VTLHPRSDWTTVKAANAHPLNPDVVRGTAVHWNGPAVPASALTDPRAYLEGVRRFHVNGNGWSDIAYNLAVDQTGDLWVLRGLGHMSAANGDTEQNTKWLAVLCIIGQGQTPSARMLAGLAAAVELVRDRYPNARGITTHAAIRPEPTACPGPDLKAAVASGLTTPEDDVTEADKDDIARKVVDLLFGTRAAGLRNQIRLALDEELGDESGLEALSNRIAGKVQTQQPLNLELLASVIADRLAARLAS